MGFASACRVDIGFYRQRACRRGINSPQFQTQQVLFKFVSASTGEEKLCRGRLRWAAYAGALWSRVRSPGAPDDDWVKEGAGREIRRRSSEERLMKDT